MTLLHRKLSDFPVGRFRIISQCRRCAKQLLIRQDLHPETTLEGLQNKMQCPACGVGDMSVSILLNRQAKPGRE